MLCHMSMIVICLLLLPSFSLLLSIVSFVCLLYFFVLQIATKPNQEGEGWLSCLLYRDPHTIRIPRISLSLLLLCLCFLVGIHSFLLIDLARNNLI